MSAAAARLALTASHPNAQRIADAADALWQALDDAGEPVPSEYPSEKLTDMLYAAAEPFEGHEPAGHWAALSAREAADVARDLADLDAAQCAAELDFIAWVRTWAVPVSAMREAA